MKSHADPHNPPSTLFCGSRVISSTPSAEHAMISLLGMFALALIDVRAEPGVPRPGCLAKQCSTNACRPDYVPVEVAGTCCGKPFGDHVCVECCAAPTLSPSTKPTPAPTPAPSRASQQAVPGSDRGNRTQEKVFFEGFIIGDIFGAVCVLTVILTCGVLACVFVRYDSYLHRTWKQYRYPTRADSLPLVPLTNPKYDSCVETPIQPLTAFTTRRAADPRPGHGRPAAARPVAGGDRSPGRAPVPHGVGEQFNEAAAGHQLLEDPNQGSYNPACDGPLECSCQESRYDYQYDGAFEHKSVTASAESDTMSQMSDAQSTFSI